MLLRLGRQGVEKDAGNAVKNYEMAVKGGNVIAMNDLGCLYASGGRGVKKDAVKARQLLQQAKNLGSKSASFNLQKLRKGVMFKFW